MWIVLFCPSSFEIRFAVFWIGIHYILIRQNIFHHKIQLWVVTWYSWSPSDIDECSQISTCDKNASCSNTQGSYSCACNPKYVGDGLTCKGLSLLIHALYIFLEMVLTELPVNNVEWMAILVWPCNKSR